MTGQRGRKIAYRQTVEAVTQMREMRVPPLTTLDCITPHDNER